MWGENTIVSRDMKENFCFLTSTKSSLLGGVKAKINEVT